jgi:hypothetical protein
MIRVLVYEFGVSLISFLLLSSLIYFGIRSKKPKKKYFFFNLSAIFIAIFLFEIYSHLKNSNHINTNANYSGSFFDNELIAEKKEHVGYGPKPDTSFYTTAIRKNNDSIIYNVNYTFENGKRFLPNNNNTSSNHLFFLGCSHVFGDGLNDNQTLPYFVNEYSNEKYNISNYGFSGYGTHQALKILENEIIRSGKLEKNKNSCVIYSFIPSHFERAAGHKIWDANGPLYEVEDNQLIFKGSFNEKDFIKENYITKRLKTIWQNSYLYKSIFEPKVKNKDVKRVVEIVKRMNNISIKNGIRFIVILGRTNMENEFENAFYQGIETCGIEHYFVSSAIPKFNDKDYTIFGDGHPNSKYNSELGKFLVDKLEVQ